MKLKDLTKEQAIQLTMLSYGFEDYYSDFEFKYQPKVDSNYENSEGYSESVQVTFNGATFGTIVDKLRFTIYSNLNCNIGYLRKDGEHLIPLRNQYDIFKLLRDWDINPE